jgi:hypothetical protein
MRLNGYLSYSSLIRVLKVVLLIYSLVFSLMRLIWDNLGIYISYPVHLLSYVLNIFDKF